MALVYKYFLLPLHGPISSVDLTGKKYWGVDKFDLGVA